MHLSLVSDFATAGVRLCHIREVNAYSPCLDQMAR